jgi:hypothetical protein
MFCMDFVQMALQHLHLGNYFACGGGGVGLSFHVHYRTFNMRDNRVGILAHCKLAVQPALRGSGKVPFVGGILMGARWGEIFKA